MKVLYAAIKHDPRDPDAASGVDHFFYTAMMSAGFEVKTLGPDPKPPAFLERGFKRYYTRWTGMKYARFALSKVWTFSRALNKLDRTWKPDLVFSVFPASLVFYRGVTPCVLDADTSLLACQREYPEYGALAMRINIWQERLAFAVPSRVITHSYWLKNILEREYRVEGNRIDVFAYPSALPRHVNPETLENPPKQLDTPLRLLLVGRDYKRKGVDIAIDTVRLLNASGVPSLLTVCGTNGHDAPHVQFVGPYKKSDPEQAKRYAELYARSHLLLHPARFDLSPIVPAEAAAFAVPTITNEVGGMATTVVNGESGVVLPKGSEPEAYGQAILDLVRDPARYQNLCVSTRKRYEHELNWDVAAKRVRTILEEAAQRR